MAETRYPVGITNRGGRHSPGLHPDGPLRHAHTNNFASRTGVNKRALCGTSIAPTPLARERFDPEHPRACRRCVAAASPS